MTPSQSERPFFWAYNVLHIILHIILHSEISWVAFRLLETSAIGEEVIDPMFFAYCFATKFLGRGWYLVVL